MSKRKPLKAPPVKRKGAGENLQWSDEDDDFQMDILSSARKVVVGSGSGQKRKLRPPHKQRVQRLVYSSSEDEAEVTVMVTEKRGQQKTRSKFTFSDSDDD